MMKQKRQSTARPWMGLCERLAATQDDIEARDDDGDGEIEGDELDLNCVDLDELNEGVRRGEL